MKFIYLKEIDSTQKYLVQNIDKFSLPVCVWTQKQTQGIGSRGNSWIGEEGNLFFSFAYEKDEFDFVPMQSLSIYFGWIFKKTLNSLGSKAIMKWPNDIYLNKKIGGVITQITKNRLICGIGLNTQKKVDEFDCLDIKIKNDKILKVYFETLSKKPSWQSVIEEFKQEFIATKERFNIDGELQEDGSILKNQKRVYSGR